jgi:hypothetical protein
MISEGKSRHLGAGGRRGKKLGKLAIWQLKNKCLPTGLAEFYFCLQILIVNDYLGAELSFILFDFSHLFSSEEAREPEQRRVSRAEHSVLRRPGWLAGSLCLGLRLAHLPPKAENHFLLPVS